MPPVHFKLTKDGHTRRIAFDALPAWSELAARLQALYHIPVDKVGVSYVDTDNDEITASSGEELQDYYQSLHQPGSPIKFSVWDLSVPRGSPTALNAPSANRNTFGQDNFEFVEAGWQGLGSFPLSGFMDATSSSEGPHAFVEIVPSDASGFGKENGDSTDTESVDQVSTVQPNSYIGKGKQRSSSFGAASITSLVGEEPSEKFPIHVFDHNSKRRGSASGSQVLGDDNISNVIDNIEEHSTPKVQAEDITEPDAPAVEPAAEEPSRSADVEDPPLPTIDTTSNSNASATLSHDVAALLTTVTNVISSHPELSEGVRNIVNNARSGVYWNAHRAALTETVNELARSEDVRRHAEEEAARRVNDALGGIFRSLSLGADNTNADANDNSAHGEPAHAAHRPRHGPHRPIWFRRSTTALDAHRPWSAPWYLPPWHVGGDPPFFGPPLHGHFHHGPPPRHGYPRGPLPPSPFPPPPQAPRMSPPLPQPSPPPAEDVPTQQSPKPETPPVGGAAPPSPGSHYSHSPRGPRPGSPPGSHGHHGGRHMRGGLHGPPLPRGPHGHRVFVHPPPPPPLPHDHMHQHHGPLPHGHMHHGPLPHGHMHHGPPPPRPLPPHGPPSVHGLSQVAGPPPPPPPANRVLPQGPNGPPLPARTAQLYSGPSALPESSRVYVNQFHAPDEPAAKPTEQELREQVEEAKWAYKAQKEAYRKHRDERKKEKETRNKDEDEAKLNPALEEGPPQIVSHGRGGYPQLEMISVPGPGPRRYHTHLGHGRHGSSSRGVERKAEDFNTRAQSRIAKRLADMGFSETGYPDLPEKIKAQMPGNGAISKEEEDDAVTTLLEEMLARSARSPGGRVGAWH